MLSLIAYRITDWDDVALTNENNSTMKWYQGGTLQNATVAEWKQAASRDKLATCAYWVSKTDFKWSDRSELKPHAKDLLICIDETISGVPMDKDNVNGVAALCLTMLGFRPS